MTQITRAWCEDANKIMTIVEARQYYFSNQNPHGKKLTFRCANLTCRETLNPLIIATNYHKKVGDFVQKPCFKISNDHPHINTCRHHRIYEEARQQCLTKQARVAYAIKENLVPTILAFDTLQNVVKNKSNQSSIETDVREGFTQRRYTSAASNQSEKRSSGNRITHIDEVVDYYLAMTNGERHAYHLSFSKQQATKVSFFDLFQNIENIEKFLSYLGQNIFFSKLKKVSAANGNIRFYYLNGLFNLDVLSGHQTVNLLVRFDGKEYDSLIDATDNIHDLTLFILPSAIKPTKKDNLFMLECLSNRCVTIRNKA